MIVIVVGNLASLLDITMLEVMCKSQSSSHGISAAVSLLLGLSLFDVLCHEVLVSSQRVSSPVQTGIGIHICCETLGRALIHS